MKKARVVRPTLIEQHRAYYLVDKVFDQLKRGEIDSIRGEPHFQDPMTGEWFEVHAAMSGWCEAWARLIRRFCLDQINLGPVLQLIRMLHAGSPIAPELVEQSVNVVEQTRKAFRGMDIHVVRQIVRDTRISIQLQDMGVIPEKIAEEILS